MINVTTLIILLATYYIKLTEAFHTSSIFHSTAFNTKILNKNEIASKLYSSTITPTSTTSSSLINTENDHDNNDNEPKVGVLFLNLGGPEKTDDVEGFLYNLFADPDIIRLPDPLTPLQPLIARGIAKKRAPKSIAAYDSIGGGSPILQYTYDQAKCVTQILKDKYELNANIYVGMRYWHPFTEEAYENIKKDGIDALVVIPLYPQFSISTSGSSLRILQEALVKTSVDNALAAANEKTGGNSKDMVHTVIPSWYQREGYVQCMAKLIQNELDSFTEDELIAGNYTRHVLFSAHGVPKSYIEVGDPYQKQIEDCVQRITSLLPASQQGVCTHLSYQSRVGPIEWLRPYTDDVIPFLGQTLQCKNLVVVPISFVSEHIETLEEIDMEYRELAEDSGVINWRRCPALNTNEGFINDMADMIYESLYNEPIQTVTEACVNNNVNNIMEYTTSTLDQQVLDKEMISEDNIVQQQNNNKDQSSSFVQKQFAERINGRIAILGVLITIGLELIYGKSIFQLFNQ